MKCRICKSNNTFVYLKSVPTTTLYNSKSQKRWDHYKCRDCKTIFIDPMPTIRDIQDIYDTPDYYFFWEKDYEKNLRVRFDNEMRKLKILKKLIKLSKAGNGRILDLGCGLGHFLQITTPYFSELYGVDHSKVALEKIDRTRIKTSKHFFNIFKKDFFNIISAWDVLEHLDNPKKYLKEIYKILKSNGHIIISTPNSGSIAATIFKEQWENIVPPNHIFIFSRQSIVQIFKEAGFRNIKIYPASRHDMYPPLGIYTILLKLIGMNPQKRLIMESEKFNQKKFLPVYKSILYYIYYKIATIISFPINLLGYGDNILVVATK